MALIKCAECGKEISEHAVSCPNCGFPINKVETLKKNDKADEIEKYFDLALNGIKGKNSEQVEKYCQIILEIDPTNSRAWELEARGLLFQATLRDNKIIQAISAAANAVNYSDSEKEELAVSLYSSIYSHINGLLNIALSMPILYAPNFVAQCMNYYGLLLSGIPCLPIEKIESELKIFEELDNNSKKSIMPKKRLIYASHATKPMWAEQYRMLLKEKGII